MTNTSYKLTSSGIIYGDTFLRNEAHVRQWFPQLAKVTDHDLDALLADILHAIGKLSGGFYDTVKQNATIDLIACAECDIIQASGNGWEANWERPRPMEEILASAARMDDFDEALACIQDVLDIDGSMAGEYFDETNRECWGLMESNDRRALLSGYVDFETYQE
jgi:hypothetical protein